MSKSRTVYLRLPTSAKLESTYGIALRAAWRGADGECGGREEPSEACLVVLWWSEPPLRRRRDGSAAKMELDDRRRPYL